MCLIFKSWCFWMLCHSMTIGTLPVTLPDLQTKSFYPLRMYRTPTYISTIELINTILQQIFSTYVRTSVGKLSIRVYVELSVSHNGNFSNYGSTSTVRIRYGKKYSFFIKPSFTYVPSHMYFNTKGTVRKELKIVISSTVPGTVACTYGFNIFCVSKFTYRMYKLPYRIYW